VQLLPWYVAESSSASCRMTSKDCCSM
jgi:hypothetical protein